MLAIDHVHSYFGVNFWDYCMELFKVNDSISVFVCELNHLINFSTRKVLSNWSCNFFKLFRTESSTSSCIKCLKNCLESGFISWITSKTENLNKGSETKLSWDSCWVNNRQNLAGLRFKVECFNSVYELINGNVSTAVIVEDIEDFFESYDCLSGEIFLNVLGGVEGWFGCRFGHKIYLI